MLIARKVMLTDFLQWRIKSKNKWQIWKEAVLADFEVLSRHFSEVTDKPKQNSVSIDSSPRQVLNLVPPK